MQIPKVATSMDWKLQWQQLRCRSLGSSLRLCFPSVLSFNLLDIGIGMKEIINGRNRKGQPVPMIHTMMPNMIVAHFLHERISGFDFGVYDIMCPFIEESRCSVSQCRRNRKGKREQAAKNQMRRCHPNDHKARRIDGNVKIGLVVVSLVDRLAVMIKVAVQEFAVQNVFLKGPKDNATKKDQNIHSGYWSQGC